MTISPFPSPTPSRSQSQDTFDTATEAFLTHLPTFVSEANAVAVAMNLNSTTDTSVSSVAIGLGAKTFIVTAGKSFQPGMYLVIADAAASSTNSMTVQVTSYSGTSLVVNCVALRGSGTIASWVISQSGAATDIAADIHASTSKTTPVGADELGIWDSVTGLLNRVSFTNALSWFAAKLGNASNVFSVAPATVAAHALRAAQYGSQINGWTYANNGADATNDLDIAAGSGLDSTRAYFISGAALTKQSDVAWAVGTNAGMLDTGAVGDSDYYLWAIARSDTGVVDYLSSLSNTAPTMPASYDYKRLIGWFKRTAGTVDTFTTYETGGGGIRYAWTSPSKDVDLVNTLTTARRTDAIRVPLNFSVLAMISIVLYDATATFGVLICDPNQADTGSPAEAHTLNISSQSTAGSAAQQLEVRTSATGTIAARANIATVDTYQVSTYSFIWERRL